MAHFHREALGHHSRGQGMSICKSKLLPAGLSFGNLSSAPFGRILAESSSRTSLPQHSLSLVLTGRYIHHARSEGRSICEEQSNPGVNSISNHAGAS